MRIGAALECAQTLKNCAFYNLTTGRVSSFWHFNSGSIDVQKMTVLSANLQSTVEKKVNILP